MLRLTIRPSDNILPFAIPIAMPTSSTRHPNHLDYDKSSDDG